jgi:hypothetical protein
MRLHASLIDLMFETCRVHPVYQPTRECLRVVPRAPFSSFRYELLIAAHFGFGARRFVGSCVVGTKYL